MIFGYMYKELEKYTHLALFGISAITIINVNYDYNYSANLNLIKYYLLGELFILPSKYEPSFLKPEKLSIDFFPIKFMPLNVLILSKSKNGRFNLFIIKLLVFLGL